MIDPLSIITKIAPHAGSASLPILAGFMLFTPATDSERLEHDFARHVAEERTTTVQNLVSDLKDEPAGAYRDTLCRTLESTLTQICLDSPGHPFCIDRAVLMSKARCE